MTSSGNLNSCGFNLFLKSITTNAIHIFQVNSSKLHSLLNFTKGRITTVKKRLFVSMFVCVNVPVNNFSVMSGLSNRVLGITSTFGELSVLLKDTTRHR